MIPRLPELLKIKILGRCLLLNTRLMKCCVVTLLVVMISGVSPAFGQNMTTKQNKPIHSAPVILKAHNHYPIEGRPLSFYRLIKNEGGVAQVIPFQIDEQNHFTDFILTTATSNKPLAQSDGLFNDNDELVFMGQDMGESEVPKVWNFAKPAILYRIDAQASGQKTNRGTVFVGLYPESRSRPALSTKKYVDFNLDQASIITSKYVYDFDPNNYLVVRRVLLLTPQKEKKKIIQSSSFYLRSDFKYFLTFQVGHSDLKSTLDAYKVGPIRAIVKVSFQYVFLKLNFEMGMYTEVSFFDNSVMLPTLMHNPLDGKRTLNQGSGFYYGFAMPFNMQLLNPQSNMLPYSLQKRRKLFHKETPVKRLYRLKIDNDIFVMYILVEPSKKMIERNNKFEYYLEYGNPLPIMQRPWERPLPLGKAPVNLGVHLDLSNFAEGEHFIGFQLFL
ncbi:MAG: hypothetical protein OXC40_02780, partial [Proteobacteria bacterium]|nr:hypothetical protein [Pseudomonadota bacterium]